jgi:zinc protease
MKKYFFTPLLLLIGLGLQVSMAQQQELAFSLEELEIPHEKFVLDNGLTLIVHEDHKSPIAAVNVWYHVGSKNEKYGKTGFAHLFEHLMFNGSENFNTDYFEAMERIGATDLNGTTNVDRTNYFQNVPVTALDVALWMESDRMGHFEGAISQERLDEQRGVVQNEKRQGENQPYGRSWNALMEESFPFGHPYSHSVIGSLEDLDAASLEDVKEWFKNYYGAANAVVVVAGDVNAEEVYNKAVKYFADIPAGPPLTRPEVNIAKRTGEKRIEMQDQVPQARIYMSWNVPEWGNPEAFLLDFAAGALADGKNSRLYKRLVYDEQIASKVGAWNSEMEIAGMFTIYADVKPGIDAAVVEKAINEELTRLLMEGPTEKEMLSTKTQYFSKFIKGLERIGGFGGKSDILASNQVYGNDPAFYRTRNQGMKEATAAAVKEVANKWLSDGKLVLEITPVPTFKTTPSVVDRSKGLPEVATAGAVKFPELQRFTLSNGLKVVLAQRESVPLVRFNLMVDAGYAADQLAAPGTASLTLNMMDEGTKSRNSLQINDELNMLGADLYAYSDLDYSYVKMTALKPMLESSIDLYTDVLLNPSFNEEDFERLRKEQLMQIQQEKASPFSMALRVFPKFMYGDGHAYSNPLSGSGYESTVTNLQRDDLLKFYGTWFKPNNATLVVTGDINQQELKKLLEKRLNKWESAEVPVKNLVTVKPGKKKIYLMDKPGAIQSVIIAGHVASQPNAEEEVAIEMMNNILGGQFTSRVNMNLREAKGWSYGARTLLMGAKGQRPFIAYAPVQSDKTQESMQEMIKEVSEYLGARPATEEEFLKVQNNGVLKLPGRWETLSAVESAASEIVKYQYPDNYYQNYSDNVKGLKLAKVQDAARKLIKPEDISWVVVGDRAQIEEKLRNLGFGELVIINSDGEVEGEEPLTGEIKSKK